MQPRCKPGGCLLILSSQMHSSDIFWDLIQERREDSEFSKTKQELFTTFYEDDHDNENDVEDDHKKDVEKRTQCGVIQKNDLILDLLYEDYEKDAKNENVGRRRMWIKLFL